MGWGDMACRLDDLGLRGLALLGGLLVLDLVGNLVEADLLGDALSALPVLGTGLVVEDGVDLLEGQTLELGKEEDGVEEADDAEAHEDDVRLVTDVGEHDGGDLGDCEVHDPVDGRRDGHSLGAHIEGEDLGGDDPSERTPGDGEPGDVPVHHEDGAVTSSLVAVGESSTVDSDDARDRGVRDGHVELSNGKHGLTAELQELISIVPE
jgi:hypothetical protein